MGTTTMVLAGMVAEVEEKLLMAVMDEALELRSVAMADGVLYGGDCDRKVR